MTSPQYHHHPQRPRYLALLLLHLIPPFHRYRSVSTICCIISCLVVFVILQLKAMHPLWTSDAAFAAAAAASRLATTSTATALPTNATTDMGRVYLKDDETKIPTTNRSHQQQQQKQHKAPKDKTRYGIHIVGERHTATKWLHSQLQRCFPDIPIYMGLNRHAYFFQQDSSQYNYGLVLALFRHPYDWFQRMNHRPLHAPMHYNLQRNIPMAIRDFLQVEWAPADRTTIWESHQTNTTTTTSTPCQEQFQMGEVIPCSIHIRQQTLSLLSMQGDPWLEDGDASAVYEMKRRTTVYPTTLAVEEDIPMKKQNDNHKNHVLIPYSNIIQFWNDKMKHFLWEIPTFQSVEAFQVILYEEWMEHGMLSTDFIVDWIHRFYNNNINNNSHTSSSSFFNTSSSLCTLNSPPTPLWKYHPQSSLTSSSSPIYSSEFIQTIHQHIDWKIVQAIGYSNVNNILPTQYNTDIFHLDKRWKQTIHPPHIFTIPINITHSKNNNNNNYNNTTNTTMNASKTLTTTDIYGPKVGRFSLENILQSIHLPWHPQERKQRFPSRDTRVRIYMSNWYNPPVCKNEESRSTSIPSIPFYYFTQSNNNNNNNNSNTRSQHPTLYLYSEYGLPNRFDSKISMDVPFLLYPPNLERCTRTYHKNESSDSFMMGFYDSYPFYCKDSMEILLLGLNNTSTVTHTSSTMSISTVTNTIHINDTSSSKSLIQTPFIVQFGDSLARSRTVPIISKFRMHVKDSKSLALVTSFTESSSSSSSSSCHRNENHRYLQVLERPVDSNYGWDTYYWKSTSQSYYQPIIWNLNYERHFGYETLLYTRVNDIPWEGKILGIKYVGDMNGGPPATEIPSDIPNLGLCLLNTRCHFVYQHRNSTLIDAHLFYSPYEKLQNFEVEGYSLFTKDMIPRKEMLKYKIVLSLEGNDVSSSLKWNLLSNSVVMMPPPTATSWLMEELLEPWVHYIPIKDDGSNAEEMVKWVGDHDLEARKIAERGTLYMYDLLYHPDAKQEDLWIKKEIIRRYKRLWS